VIGYDRLVVATGAVSARPPIPGIELPGVRLLHSMGDASAVRDALAGGARSAVIIGAGYIGVEMADALVRRGIDVSVIEQARSALTTIDPELGALVVDELTAHGVRCSIGARVTGIEPSGDRLVVTAEDGSRAEGEIVLVLAGVQPDTRLARDAGASLGVRGAIAVDRQMRIGLPDIWRPVIASRPTTNCWTRLCTCPSGVPRTSRGASPVRMRSAGAPISPGSLGTQVVKVFDLAIAATGLRESAARAKGFDPLTVETTADDHKAYYPGAHPLRLRIVGDREHGTLLGAQILGHFSSQVAKRIDTLATAIYHRMTVAEVSDLDLSYTPPLSSPWDRYRSPAKPGSERSDPTTRPPPRSRNSHERHRRSRRTDTQGVRVARHNPTSDPDAFVANPKVTGFDAGVRGGGAPSAGDRR
jgi:NADPH-dependent 2,4-dienoyl-CoA reductase/sulfur reductase-like enzyme